MQQNARRSTVGRSDGGEAHRDALGRRQRTGPPRPRIQCLTLSEADLAVFAAIDRHGPLPSHYLFEFQRHLRADATNFQKRLAELFHGDQASAYLLRPPRQFDGFRARYQHLVYDVTPSARALLAERGLLGRFGPRRQSPFLHQLMSACVGASLELSAQRAGLRYISREEILARAGRPDSRRQQVDPMAITTGATRAPMLIPDDLFGLEYPGVGFRFFAVEIDRNTEAIERSNLAVSSFARKVDGYLTVLRGRRFIERWNIPNLTVLTVTTNAIHADNLADHIRQRLDPHGVRFAFATDTSFGVNWAVPQSVMTHLLSDPWITSGGPKAIDRP